MKKRLGFFYFCKTITPKYNRMTILTIGWAEVLLIALIVLLLFGAKKIPELMKGLGKGVKSFKEGVNGIDDLDDLNKKRDQEKQDKE